LTVAVTCLRINNVQTCHGLANNGMQRTRNQQVFEIQSPVRAGDAGRWMRYSVLSSTKTQQ